MDDDFLKKHQVRPNPQFVESLYQEIETQSNRRFAMLFKNMKKPIRLSLVVLCTLLAIGLFSFVFSPTVRAAMQSLFTLNGVEVGVDEETGEIVTSGNTDAIIAQDAHAVLIDGGSEAPIIQDGGKVTFEDVVVEVESAASSRETVTVTDLATRFPDFVLPTNVPAGYELSPDATVVNGTLIGVDWRNATGQMIHYEWGGEAATENNSVVSLQTFDPTGEGGIFMGGLVIASGQSKGVNYSIAATDLSLSEAALQEMAP